MSYAISDYCDMIRDSVRMEAYLAALERVVTPESIVLDMGCGTGIFAMQACHMGAKRVFGIEPNPAVEMAKKLAVDNGFADRITYFRAFGKDVTLPEKATVMISDLRGSLPIHGHHFDIVRDARKRLLSDDATIIPSRDDLHLSLVYSPKAYASVATPWGEHDYGVNFSRITEVLTNSWHHVDLGEDATFSEAQKWTTLDYEGDLPNHISNQHSWTVETDVTYHGVCLWFDCTLIDDVGYSCNPAIEEKPSVYGHGFFPFPAPLHIKAGGTVTVQLAANQIQDGYVFSWNTFLESDDATPLFKQSTMMHSAGSPESFRQRSDNHIPSLNTDGTVACLILKGFEAGMALGEIARDLSATFPETYPSWQVAMGIVGDFSILCGTVDVEG